MCVYVCTHVCVWGAFAHVCMYRGQKVLSDVFLYWSLPIYLFIPLFTYFFLSQVLQKLNSPVCLQWLSRALPVSDPAIFQLWGVTGVYCPASAYLSAGDPNPKVCPASAFTIEQSSLAPTIMS